MRHFSKILLILILFNTNAYSQFLFKRKADTVSSNDVLYRYERTWGLNVHSLGWGINFKKGKNINAFKKRLLEVELISMGDPKQTKISNYYLINSNSYIYGKLNSVCFLRTGFNKNILLNRKPYRGGIELRYFYSGGVSIGFAKPIYLYIANYTFQNGYYSYFLTTEKYNPEEHFPFNVNVNGRTISIYGKASLFKGFNKIKIYPGIYSKFGFNFDFASESSHIKKIEIGTAIDLFPIPIPIMAFCDKKYAFFTFYINFSIGKKYN